MHRLQYPQGQPAPARSAHDFDSQTEAPEVAPVRSDHVFRAAARPLEALCRSRLLECRAERLGFTEGNKGNKDSLLCELENRFVIFVCYDLGASEATIASKRGSPRSG